MCKINISYTIGENNTHTYIFTFGHLYVCTVCYFIVSAYVIWQKWSVTPQVIISSFTQSILFSWSTLKLISLKDIGENVFVSMFMARDLITKKYIKYYLYFLKVSFCVIKLGFKNILFRTCRYWVWISQLNCPTPVILPLFNLIIWL